MSSYLRRLAERSLGVQPAVKPRLPTRYEPADASGAGLIEAEVMEIADAAGDASERPLAPEQRTPSMPPVPPMKQPIVERPAAERPVERVDITADTVDPAPVRARRQRREEPPAAPETAGPEAEKRPPIREIVERIHHVTAVQPGQPVVSPRQTAASDRPASKPDRPAVLPRKPFSPSTAPRSNGSVNAETEPALRPALKPEPASPLRQSPDAPEPEPPAPAIQVTIGRIEVRAAPPPEKAGRRRAERPVMSLDDYMRKRREGGGK